MAVTSSTRLSSAKACFALSYRTRPLVRNCPQHLAWPVSPPRRRKAWAYSSASGPWARRPPVTGHWRFDAARVGRRDDLPERISSTVSARIRVRPPTRSVDGAAATYDLDQLRCHLAIRHVRFTSTPAVDMGTMRQISTTRARRVSTESSARVALRRPNRRPSFDGRVLL